MLGWLFYLFRKYGDDIAGAYKECYGRLEIESDMSGVFIGYGYDMNTTPIFRFVSVKEAIKLFNKEIGRLHDGE